MGQLLHAVSGLAVHTLFMFTLLLHTPVNAVDVEQGKLHLHTNGTSRKDGKDGERLQGVIFVTELLAGEVPDEGPLHYLELYNSSHQPVDLSVLTITAGSRTIEIGSTLTIGPYRQFVVANRESRLVQPNLTMSSLEIPAPSGEVEIRRAITRKVDEGRESLECIKDLE